MFSAHVGRFDVLGVPGQILPFVEIVQEAQETVEVDACESFVPVEVASGRKVFLLLDLLR